MKSPQFDIASLHEAYAAGTKPAEIIEIVFSRLAAAEDPGIFIHLADKAELIAAAEALGPFDAQAKPLWGVPFAVKDNIDVAGMPTTAACPAFAYRPRSDATVVRLLKEAGALVIGKTNLDQFATGLVGVRTPYPVPRNALDAALVPGGSSSGSAVATARGIVSFALGTDTAGSGRVPAGLNNVVGLKPTVGALSTTGVVPACRTLDCVSILALTVEDAYSVFSIAARQDSLDPFSKAVRAPPLAPRAPVLRVGVPAAEARRFFGDHAMAAGFDAALERLQALGCEIVALPFEDFYRTANLLYEGAWVAERYAAISDFMAEHEEAMHPVTRKIIGGARRLTAADAFNGIYALQALKAKLNPIISSVDLICVPTAPTHYTVADVENDPIATNSRLGVYTNFVNLLDMCGIAVPIGMRGDGLPMNVTLIAAAGKDADLAGLAIDLHRETATVLGATDWPVRPAGRPGMAGPDDAIEIAVVGAHLSGMPLNKELRSLGAVFCRAVRTVPGYRLFALAGHSVPKPGLLREAGATWQIETEVWKLRPDAFGQFVAAIPSPLGIGTIELEDSTSPKGFLVEPAGLSGAADISFLGGWRSYINGLAHPR
jgi:allophanate hydrolase